MDLNLAVSSVPIRWHLIDNNLFARSSRKIPLLNKKKVAASFKFAQEHIKRKTEKHTVESKIILFSGTGFRQYVKRPPPNT